MLKSCKEIRSNILSISKESGHGHVPSCFSIVEIIYAIYDTIRHNPKNPTWDERDIFILSKGHGALAHYCVLSRFGYFNIKEVYAFGKCGSQFGCHADRLKIPGVEASTGSLGHGIGISVGIALAFKLKKSERKVYVTIGDGESNEGTIWEALMVASDLALSNLTILYDNNKSQDRGLQIRNPAEKFRAFGGRIFEANGHEVDELKFALNAEADNIKVIIANTRKGYGCSTLMENHHAWHRRSPTEEEFKQLIGELNASAI